MSSTSPSATATIPAATARSPATRRRSAQALGRSAPARVSSASSLTPTPSSASSITCAAAPPRAPGPRPHTNLRRPQLPHAPRRSCIVGIALPAEPGTSAALLAAVARRRRAERILLFSRASSEPCIPPGPGRGVESMRELSTCPRGRPRRAPAAAVAFRRRGGGGLPPDGLAALAPGTRPVRPGVADRPGPADSAARTSARSWDPRRSPRDPALPALAASASARSARS